MNPTFEEIGHFRIKGVHKSQKNWMIYAFVEKNKANLLIEDYKNKGELLFAFDKNIYPLSHWHNKFILFDKLSRNTFENTLNQIKDYLGTKYKSLRWFVNQDKIDKIKTILRLTE